MKLMDVIRDPREGGAFRISLTYDEQTGIGKTTAHTDTYHGRFIKLIPNERVVEVMEFETVDDSMRGEMTITFTLTDADGGTDVLAVHDHLPPGLSPADNRCKAQENKMSKVIARRWQGKVSAERAEEYAQYHYENGVQRIQSIAGNLGVEVLRRTIETLVEFTTISYWESQEAIRRFAGEDINKPHHLPRDAEYLIELPQEIVHYELDFSDLQRVAQCDWRTLEQGD